MSVVFLYRTRFVFKTSYKIIRYDTSSYYLWRFSVNEYSYNVISRLFVTLLTIRKPNRTLNGCNGPYNNNIDVAFVLYIIFARLPRGNHLRPLPAKKFSLAKNEAHGIRINNNENSNTSTTIITTTAIIIYK